MGPAARVVRLARRVRPGHRHSTGSDAAAEGPVGFDPERVLELGSATATGPRADNQDRAAVGPGWAVVSDGAGGHRGGARAAELTVEAVTATFAGAGAREPAQLDRAVQRANEAVRQGRDDPEVPTMAATVTIALAGTVSGTGSTWWLTNVGDSPAWRVGPDGAVSLLPADNVAAELVRVGMITEEEAASHPGRHQITRAVGGLTGPERTPVAVDLGPGECLVLASDGILALDTDALAAIVTAGTSAQEIASALVAGALAADVTDNVTVVVVRHRTQADDGGSADGGR
jgi:serine/threonine protein phosphatase PrpC